jgi:ubiquinone biosynthesis accessory factor UbiJ
MSKPPFLFPPVDVLQRLAASAPPPPAWLRIELENRLVLCLNHVLMQESQATERLRRQSGKTLRVQWDRFECALQATPAGLLARSEATSAPDLRLSVQEPSPVALVQKVLQGDKPQVDIQGDVQLAAEVAWLVDNVRWDVEEDLSRILGDAAAHTLVKAMKTAAQGLRAFLQKAAP